MGDPVNERMEETVPEKKLTARETRQITQKTGAHVTHIAMGSGVVTGHYDDDVVYVTFGREPEGVLVTDLRISESDQMFNTAPPDGEVIALDGMPLADIKGLFAADGTFSVNPPFG